MIRKLNDETTVDIPKGYCAFDFAALRSQVFDAFQREPLKFQILVQHNNSLEVLADGQADLRKVLESPDILSTVCAMAFYLENNYFYSGNSLTDRTLKASKAAAKSGMEC